MYIYRTMLNLYEFNSSPLSVHETTYNPFAKEDKSMYTLFSPALKSFVYSIFPSGRDDIAILYPDIFSSTFRFLYSL